MLGASTAQAHRRRNAAPAFPLQSGAHSNTFVVKLGLELGQTGCACQRDTWLQLGVTVFHRLNTLLCGHALQM